ncbi:MAG: hypothetical protein AB2569_00140 [Candidatus Thiodiazotropha endolucinida]
MDLSFNQTSMDLRERFFSLLDSLSALRALSQINLDGITEDELITKALDELVRYHDGETGIGSIERIPPLTGIFRTLATAHLESVL